MILTTVRMAREGQRGYDYMPATIDAEQVVTFHPIKIGNVRNSKDCTTVLVGHVWIIVDQAYPNFRAKMSKLLKNKGQ